MIGLRKADWLFGLAVLAVILFIALLPSPRQRNPVVPADAEHRAVASEMQCSACHSPQARQPLPTRHPKRTDCFKCHRRDDRGGA